MSLFAELQRRSVFKVGAAYLVVAWLVVQAASIAFPTFEAPAWALRVFIFVVMLGFPIALVIAWAVELTPEGVKLDAAAGSTRFFVVTGAIAALAVAWFYLGQPSYKSDDPQVSDGPPSVAVLPFANLSSDPEQEFFSDGMTEELLNVLARIPTLRVAARTSVFEFKGKGGDAREIGRKLGVQYLVEGSVRRAGERVRVTAQLIRVADGFHLWSETFERDTKDVFALQDEIARRVGGQLKVSLGDAAVQAPRAGIDPVAYDEYLKGRALHRARRDITEAVAHLRRAVEIAPEFDQAWAYLSLALEVVRYTETPLATIGFGADDAGVAAAAARAAALAPDAPTTLHALGNVARAAGRFAEAEALYLRARATDPGYTDAGEDLAELYGGVGDHAAALRVARELVVLEPFVRLYWTTLMRNAARTGERAEFERAAQRMAELDVKDSASTRFISIEMAADRLGTARGLVASWPAQNALRGGLATMLLRWAERDPAIDDAMARAQLMSLDEGWLVFADLRGERDFLLDMLANPQFLAKHHLYMILRSARLTRAIEDPRAKRMLRELGYEAYWRAKGWPAECQPVSTKSGDADFECRALPAGPAGAP